MKTFYDEEIKFDPNKDYELSILCEGEDETIKTYMESGQLKIRFRAGLYRWIYLAGFVEEDTFRIPTIRVSAMFSDYKAQTSFKEKMTEEQWWNKWAEDMEILIDELRICGAFRNVDYSFHELETPGHPDWNYPL